MLIVRNLYLQPMQHPYATCVTIAGIEASID